MITQDTTGAKGESTSAAERQRTMQMLLVSEHGRLLGYIRKHFPDSLSPLVEPADVLHDTYFDAIPRLGNFTAGDGEAVFRLLATIARRRIAQLLRIRCRTKHGGRSKRIAQTDSVAAMLSELAVHRRTPSRSAAGHEFLVALDRALEGLPADLRTAVTLRYIEGLSPEEIAQQMNRTVRAAHQLCYRGIQLVRRELRSASLFV
jgi:RNA polymerase sigma-70 factor (ECF subfamily)